MAVRITLKRSSIYNKRPNPDILDPGELALNTNSETPGLFFETEDNSVVKVGPTAVGVRNTIINPSLGETFFNSVTNALSIGVYEDQQRIWRDITGPYLGGTNGYVVFVAPEFPTATDSLDNDGQASPFSTLNRAIIEIAKQSIVQENESDREESNRFTILIQPGLNAAYNGPGLPLPSSTNTDQETFQVNFDESQIVSPVVLTAFNPSTGGLLIPRGTSISGLDIRKTIVTPSYIPTYKAPSGKPNTVNQPLSSILKWTGNSYVSNVTFKDKIITSQIVSVQADAVSGAEFTTDRTHGLALNDAVEYTWVPRANQIPPTASSPPVLNGTYYVYPTSERSFRLSYTPITASSSNYIEYSQVPVQSTGLAFFAEVTWNPYSHAKLACIDSATKEELNEFYTKVQRAFPSFFKGRVDQAEVINPGETEYVAPAPNTPSLLSNNYTNGSPYASNVTTRSSYGLCGIRFDGDAVSGFRSTLAQQFTVASLQNDPEAYAVYSTVTDPDSGTSITGWNPLAYATWNSLPVISRPPYPYLVPRAAQMEFLNSVPLSSVRYYYESLTNENGDTYGIADPENDFRHFGFKVMNSGYMQCDSTWTISCAIGFWAMNGAKMSVTGSASNFGSMALRSEGFAGLGSVTGATSADTGFSFAGIRMPQKLNAYYVNNFHIFSLGASVESVETDPATGVQTMTLGSGFEPITLLPYSLAPNTAIWIQSGNTFYRGFFIDDGKPTAKFLPTGQCQLRIRAIDSSIPDGVVGVNASMNDWEPPFIKRFQDTRTVGQQAYSLILQNTSPDHRDPSPEMVLRLNQNAVTTSQSVYVRPGVQFDPGPSGGWGRVFKVIYSQTSSDGDAPQYNETLLNRPTSSYYYTALALVDGSRPWLETLDRPHGAYITFSNRNWYATCNDDWDFVYFSSNGAGLSNEKLIPENYDSPYAGSSCLENQYLVKKTFQGKYAPDPLRELYFEDGTYFRGSQTTPSNYDFSEFFDQDNGTLNFGLLRHDVPSGVSTTTDGVTTVDTDRIKVTDIDIISNSSGTNTKKDFVVVSLHRPQEEDRIEYCQVVGYDFFTDELVVVRGLYGTKQDKEWSDGTLVDLQSQNVIVNDSDYDLDWAPSKTAMIRFLEIMGFSATDIKAILQPRTPSKRNLLLKDLAVEPKNGYALATGAWGLEFNIASSLQCVGHQFHSVGHYNPSRGLPANLRSNLNTKQYYDFLASVLWGGQLTMFGQDENGQTVLEGLMTQGFTGRPYGSLSSEITDYPRIQVNTREDGEVTYVQLVETGVGLTGGPITESGTISLLPATNNTIGGVKPGSGVILGPGGEISVDTSGFGTVSSITAGLGLDGGTITKSGTINLLPATNTVIGGVTPGLGLSVSAGGALNLLPATVATLGGITPGTGLDVSVNGALSLMPPSADGNVIGGVKAGDGIVIAADGTISAASGPSGVLRLDPLNFNGIASTFTLTSNSKPVFPADSSYVLIVVGGVVQTTPTSYSVTGSTITFTAVPPAGSSFYGVLFL